MQARANPHIPQKQHDNDEPLPAHVHVLAL